MFELLKMPEAWFTSAAVVGSCLSGYIAYEIASFELRRRRPVEKEIKIDMDLFSAEMSMEAAVLEYRLANERRAEMVARAS